MLKNHLFPVNLVTIVFIFFVFSTGIKKSVQATALSDSVNSVIKHSDILWASPKGFDLTMDIYQPKGLETPRPVVIIYHGGGWLINRKKIMNQSAEYLALYGNYVVCNVNYRLLGDLENTTTMNEIVEDALGAVLWVKEYIQEYGGNPDEIIVTGDSAGGHLAMMVVMHGENLYEDGFSSTSLGFNPTWRPKDKSLDEIKNEHSLEVQAAMISYGAFDIYSAVKYGGLEKPSNFFWQMGQAQARGIFGDSISIESHPEYYATVSPINTIQSADSVNYPPMLFTVGEMDNLTTPESIQYFMKQLEEKGHDNLEYWLHEGRPHAFLDSGKNEFLGIAFEKDAPPALDRMIEFLDKYFGD